jgi:hypothetical protein
MGSARACGPNAAKLKTKLVKMKNTEQLKRGLLARGAMATTPLTIDATAGSPFLLLLPPLSRAKWNSIESLLRVGFFIVVSLHKRLR